MFLLFRVAYSVFRWIKEYLGSIYPTSVEQVVAAEKKILSHIKSPFKTYYVNIGPVVGEEDCKVWTISLNEDAEKIPIVLVHGLCQAIVNWVFNLDALATERPVYAFDLLGFGRSSRPDFSADPLEAEKQFVDSIEAWRKEIKLEKFILLGCSMGGFLATSYAFRFPNRLHHLILEEPWGFPKEPCNRMNAVIESYRYETMPFSLATMVHLTRIFNSNPYLLMRIVGLMRLGPNIVVYSIPWLEKFSALGENGVRNVAEYIFHANSQNPTGEAALVSMSSNSGMLWAAFPMVERISLSLDKKIPITFVFGTESWLIKTPTSDIQKMRPTSYVDEQLMQGENHHCNWEGDIFNKIVTKVCDQWDGDQNIETVSLSPNQNCPQAYKENSFNETED